VLAGELALGEVLAGELPRPAFPDRLRQSAPAAWFGLAAGALRFADVHARRGDRVACLANLGQAVLAAAPGRLAAAGTWVLNEKRLVERAGMAEVQDGRAEPARPERARVRCRQYLRLEDDIWRKGVTQQRCRPRPPRRQRSSRAAGVLPRRMQCPFC
jgi:hypothetical protein